MPVYAWKGLKEGVYASGRIEGINKDEAAFKLKEQKVIITNITRLSGSEVEEEKPSASPASGRGPRKKKVPVCISHPG